MIIKILTILALAIIIALIVLASINNQLWVVIGLVALTGVLFTIAGNLLPDSSTN